MDSNAFYFTQGMLGARNRDLNIVEGNLQRYKEALNDANATIRQERANIATLEHNIALEKACVAGYEAQIIALLAKHPDSPLRADSGRKYKSGKTKSHLRIIWEPAFDASLRQFGITDPVSLRDD